MAAALPARRKWELFLAGQDVGPMVSPLCDNWSLDQPYRWPFDRPEPFPAGHRHHALCEQMAMARLCGWDATFLAGADCTPRNADARPRTSGTPIAGGRRTEARIDTPYGPLVSVVEQKVTQHVVKAELQTEEDYRRKAWFYRQQLDYDVDAAIAEARQLAAAVGEEGVLGTWYGPPISCIDRAEGYYHLADWPEAVEELRQAARELALKRLEGLRAGGFDYLFYCVDGTEWISPDFFRRYVLDDTREILARWRALGGWVLWHSCGRVARFVEEGFYNELRPEVFETVSEPPVGDLPSLAWARERIDPAIATKGNMPLEVLRRGSEEDVRREVARIRGQTRGRRHVVGLSDDVLPGTPLANCRAMVDEARRPS